jgi:hypothetical protein
MFKEKELQRLPSSCGRSSRQSRSIALTSSISCPRRSSRTWTSGCNCIILKWFWRLPDTDILT